MLKALLKKQIAEVWRNYFFDYKKGKPISKSSTIAKFILFGLLIVVLVGGMFFGLSVALCGALAPLGLGWLYFDILAVLAILLGIFGSVFNTYASLYLAKDNDLLLSMPIPVKYIVASRLLNVYLLGLMYSGVVFVPAVLVYLAIGGIGVSTVIGCIVMLLQVSVIVLILSCLLGYVVAKISVKLKGKSFITVAISLAFIALYYVFYFNLQTIISSLIDNAVNYGVAIKDSAYLLYLFGDCACGNYVSILIALALTVLMLYLTWMLLSKTFFKLATANTQAAKSPAKSKQESALSPDKALLKKEFARFTSSSSYMLNCGLGILMVPAAGIVMAINSGEIISNVGSNLPSSAFLAMLIAIGGCIISSFNDAIAPSVSLEGKCFWQLQVLPVTPWQIIKAKLKMQLLLAAAPAVIFAICLIITVQTDALTLAMCVLLILVSLIFDACFGMYVGIKHPCMNWTTEIVPIKQSSCVAIALFGPIVFFGLLGAIGYAISMLLPIAAVLALLIALTLLTSLLLCKWLKGKGSKILSEL